MSDPTLVPLLNHLEARSTFSSDEIGALLDLPFRLSNLPAGSHLIREGDVPESCCVLLSGSVFRHKIAGEGMRQILAVHFPGDLLGLGLGLLDATDHGVQTIAQSYVAHIPHPAILDLAERFPNVARAFWRESLIEASIARQWIVSLGRGSARKRIAHLLCELATRQVALMTNDVTVRWPLTQEQMADATGLTAVHVNRKMQEIRSSGLIRTDKRSLTIVDWTSLREAGEFDQRYLHLRAPAPADLRTEGTRAGGLRSVQARPFQ